MAIPKLVNCWTLKGCPASHYIKCAAYQRRIDCWETGERNGCLCHVNETCRTCPIFRKHLEADQIQTSE